jgi:hypothetical protein
MTFPSAGPLRPAVGACAIHEDAAHHLGRHPEELRAVLPDYTLLIEKPEIGFVHELGRLEGVAARLAPQARHRALAQLRVDERQEPIAGGKVAVPPCAEQLGEVVTGAGQDASRLRRLWGLDWIRSRRGSSKDTLSSFLMGF